MKMEFKKSVKGRIAALSLAGVLVATSSIYTYSFAAEKKNVEAPVPNTETVYVMTDAQGGETQRIVSEKGELHYDGYEKETLPVTMEITYTLDGKEVKAKELAGKTGHLVMEIKYRTNTIEKKGNVPFLAITGIVVDNSHFTNTGVDHGKIIEDGNRKVIMAYGFPGVQENLHGEGIVDLGDTVRITGDVKDFKLEGMYTLMTKEIFEELNMEQKFNMDSITSQINELTGGVKQLHEGATQLNKGVGTLDAGAKKMKDGTGALAKGANDLSEGFDNLNAGSSQLKTGADKLAESSTALATGSQTLSEKITDLSTGLNAISAQSSALNAGTQQIISATFASASRELNAQMQKVNPSAQQVTLTPDNYKAVLGKLAQAVPPMAETLAQVEASLDSVLTFQQGLLQYTAGVDQAAGGATLLQNKINDEFNPGMQQLAEGAKTLSAGHNQLNSGIAEAGKGATQLAAGTNELFLKENDLLDGIKMLQEGAGKLEDGTALLDDKVSSELKKLYSNKYIDTLKHVRDVKNSAKSYKSFGKNENYETVTFIYKTDGIEKVEKN